MRRSVRPLLALTGVALPTTLWISSFDAEQSVAGGGNQASSPRPLERLSSLLTALSDSLIIHGQQLKTVDLIDTEALGGRHPLATITAMAAVPQTLSPAMLALQHEHPAMRRLPDIAFTPGIDTSATDIARAHPRDVATLRHLAQIAWGAPLPDRFTDAELMRYAITYGYLSAKTDSQRARALEDGAAAAVRSAEWRAHHHFATDEELASFSHLIRWGAPDGAGRPTLHIDIGAAVQQCRGPAALQFANALITHMERATQGLLGDDPGRPQRINVVVDAAGTTALRASRVAWVFKAVASTLNHHYPGRLHELVLTDLPVVLTWLVAGCKKLVHPATRDKVRVVRSTGLQ